jgi:hypothetical protein
MPAHLQAKVNSQKMAKYVAVAAKSSEGGMLRLCRAVCALVVASEAEHGSTLWQRAPAPVGLGAYRLVAPAGCQLPLPPNGGDFKPDDDASMDVFFASFDS